MKTRAKPAYLALFLPLAFGHGGPTQAYTLITADEAKLPDAVEERKRDPFPGPVIDVLGCQKEAFALPVALTVELKAFAGAKIDADTLRVVYMKVPKVDLTSRIRDVQGIKTTPDKKVVISIRDAEIPLGKHQIQVWAKDSRNKDSAAYFNIDVANQSGRPIWSWSSSLQRPSLFGFFKNGCGAT
jgi:hypothetical protein